MSRIKSQAAKEHKRQHDREYQHKNRETILARKRAYYALNREKILQQQRDYYRAHRDDPQYMKRLNDATKRWYRRVKATDPEGYLERARQKSKIKYWRNPEKRREESRIYRQIYPDQCKNAMKSWRERNAEQERIYRKHYYVNHKDERAATFRNWSQRNREYRNEYAKNWNRNNPEKFKERTRRRYLKYRDLILIRSRQAEVRRRNCEGEHTVSEWIDRVEVFGWVCFYCNKPLTPTTLGKDHMTPLCRGGTDYADNLVPCCYSCNSRKRHRTAEEFFEYMSAADFVRKRV